MQVSDLTGVWHLLAFESHDPTKGVSHPYGQEVDGQLIYTAQGEVSLVVMARNRTRVGVLLEDLRDLGLGWAFFRAIGRYRAALLKQFSYAGTYRVEGSAVVHKVAVASFPDWVGTELRRDAELSGQRLRLSLTNRRGVRTDLVWRRQA